MNINLIFARAANGVIGANNQLPWYLPEDLAHFKQATLGSPVLMGRKTWDSLPLRFRPLPGRLNVVITRQMDWHSEAGCVKANSIDAALVACCSYPEVWVIGGADVYRQVLPLANKVIVTELKDSFEGDAFAPNLGSDWDSQTTEWLQSTTGLFYRFINYSNTAKHST